ncbi:hypothetical protein [Chitinasiproducens palmae]|uniref:DUF4148 domain-containing protein n=1 Tax=Chitinasiproducens palmae TaxID=1770053 RepID=A0A1H2PQG6_9BURK|nr:hypothetical protein [Chitinasiproducens palmae]SDV49058.1 hypothetical protein SAMN05216551_10728 [Chitinasiproducens palmae]
MLRPLIALAALALIANTAAAQGRVSSAPDTPRTTYLSPQQAAIAAGIPGATTGPNSGMQLDGNATRCRELASSISQATARPPVIGDQRLDYTYRGRPREDVDKRAELEAEYRRLGCR